MKLNLTWAVGATKSLPVLPAEVHRLKASTMFVQFNQQLNKLVKIVLNNLILKKSIYSSLISRERTFQLPLTTGINECHNWTSGT